MQRVQNVTFKGTLHRNGDGELVEMTGQISPQPENNSGFHDYTHMDRYLTELRAHVYPQPPDPGHQAAIDDIGNRWVAKLENMKEKSILDVGCGQGQAILMLQKYAKRVTGVTLGDDAKICQDKGLEVYENDMSFLPFRDDEFQLIFARHVLEHSPMPLLTLMEWHRVSNWWLMLILPRPEYFAVQGRNHYHIMPIQNWVWLLQLSGWEILWHKQTRNIVPEFRFLCHKKQRKMYSPDTPEEEQLEISKQS